MTTQIRSKAINPFTECNTVSLYTTLLKGSFTPLPASMMLRVFDAGKREFGIAQREFLNTPESGGQPASLW
jgi:hypothetical protein